MQIPGPSRTQSEAQEVLMNLSPLHIRLAAQAHAREIHHSMDAEASWNHRRFPLPVSTTPLARELAWGVAVRLVRLGYFVIMDMEDPLKIRLWLTRKASLHLSMLNQMASDDSNG